MVESLATSKSSLLRVPSSVSYDARLNGDSLKAQFVQLPIGTLLDSIGTLGDHLGSYNLCCRHVLNEEATMTARYERAVPLIIPEMRRIVGSMGVHGCVPLSTRRPARTGENHGTTKTDF